MKRVLIATLVGIGLSCLGLALGLLYLDFTAREGAWVEAHLRGRDLSEQEQDALLAAWDTSRNFLPALVSGSLGAALLGVGLVLAAFELRVFSAKAPGERPSGTAGVG